MHIHILTLFPGMFEGPFSESILGKALGNNLATVSLHNIRDYALDRHRIVDDSPFGGGAGMVMKPDVTVSCIEAVKKNHPYPVLYLSPQGRLLTDAMVRELAREKGLILLCGHYEGVDERVVTHFVDREISIGDYVVTGGELPAMVLTDAVLRQIPKVLGDEASAREDSFAEGLLEYPQYTRPAEFRGLLVPSVLLSGHHEQIRLYRLKESLRRTQERRPELLDSLSLDGEKKRLLKEIAKEERRFNQ